MNTKENRKIKEYEKGKKDVINKVLEFVEEECEFLPDIHSDNLLDRLVKFIKNL